MWFFAMMSLITAQIASQLLDLRWSRTNAELPLLALLPGLGHGRGARRALLRAAMLVPARDQLVWLTLFVIVAALLHQGWQVDAAMLGMTLVALGMLAASALAVLGGSPLCGWPRGFLMLLALALITLTALSFTAGPQWQPLRLAHLGIGWAALLLWLLWLGRRGWRGLQQRPHPFLPN